MAYPFRSEKFRGTQRRTLLAALVEIFADSHETYGYRRVHAALLRRGEHCSAELVRALMREQGLTPARAWAFRSATTVQGDYRGIPDLVGRDFTAERPGTELVGDVTYIRTWEGFLYLATVIDCHSKAVLGWAMADHYRTDLIKDVIRMAADTGLLQPGTVFHADRDSNYTSDEFGRFLTARQIRRSVGRTGVCYDDAMAESFFSALKNEWLHRFVFSTQAKAGRQVIRYIEGLSRYAGDPVLACRSEMSGH
ncbi:IS3 family transposase [Nonomuraea sp. NPDC003707]